MKKSRFTEAQIVGILKEAENGLPMADLLRSHGVIPPFFLGPPQLDLRDPEQLALAILKTQSK